MRGALSFQVVHEQTAQNTTRSPGFFFNFFKKKKLKKQFNVGEEKKLEKIFRHRSLEVTWGHAALFALAERLEINRGAG